MRKIIVISMITIDGVMQAPGAPEEDTSGGFEYGGWVAPFGDEEYGKVTQKQMAPADILLGRKTFDIFEDYWPKHAEGWPRINEVTKYVLSSTRKNSDWQNSEFLSSIEDIKKLKNSEGGDIKVWGSATLVQLLLQHDLVDELALKIHPIILGKGKKLFNESSTPAGFKLVESTVTPSGVIAVSYKRAAEVKTGIIGE
ncbi:dihydrofolate reductase family protein [Flavobacterium sp. SORGH_AS_0622]|uniref:dihydrofolate reductase family protein n=1 Tax=Flavobacterium sp. SORGH_AS_0622 TaxID=3041772 RepID=UPI00278A7E32|nr:dihydrofolate reductase family protein [Flavobacterium sp. SORGH_AS_0622]MDQ1166658.1 dihydrofolate reductase [Flavobacterium sp. SORGH_AS_0622]